MQDTKIQGGKAFGMQMNNGFPPDGDGATGIEWIVAEFLAQIGRRPSLGELLEIFEWSSSAMYPARLRFKVRMKKSGRYEKSPSSCVDELNDAIFADAVEFLAHLSPTEHGRPPSPTGLASTLTLAFKNKSMLLHDVASDEIAKITASVVERNVKTPKVGDVLAIPVRSGGYRIALVVARNRFGTALGLLRGLFPVPRHGSTVRREASGFPFYTDDRLVSSGDWRLVGHDEGLLSLFSEDPEIYHAPDLQWPGIDLGRYGAAETATGRLRLLDKEEARAVGILDGLYKQFYASEVLQKFLDDSIDS